MEAVVHTMWVILEVIYRHVVELTLRADQGMEAVLVVPLLFQIFEHLGCFSYLLAFSELTLVVLLQLSDQFTHIVTIVDAEVVKVEVLGEVVVLLAPLFVDLAEFFGDLPEVNGMLLFVFRKPLMELLRQFLYRMLFRLLRICEPSCDISLLVYRLLGVVLGGLTL